jgi:uncharacterized protein DUF930
MRCKLSHIVVLCCLPGAARAGALDQALLKLAPEERSHQVCILKGLGTVKREARLRRADLLKTSIFSPAVLQGTLLTAKGGAVRTKNRWYAITFTCQLTGDLMKATTFSFELGDEIPKNRWDQLGLWG